MLRKQGIVSTLVGTATSVISLINAPCAQAQSAPPPPPSSYDAPPGPPPAAPPPGAAGAGANVRFEPDEPNLSLMSSSGSEPYVRARRWHHGWYAGYGWAPMYAPVCDQACLTRFAPGAYRLALSKNGGPPVPAYGVVSLERPSLIRASYTDRSGARATGWVIGFAGLIGGAVMIGLSADDELVCDDDGFCHHRETFSAPLLVGGIGVLIASGIVGTILANERDQAHLSIEPLRLSSYGLNREALAALGAPGQPQGAALAWHF
jgi:hypothetical protein